MTGHHLQDRSLSLPGDWNNSTRGLPDPARRARTAAALNIFPWRLLEFGLRLWSGHVRKNAASEGVADRCRFLHGDANRLAFPDESFNAVVSNYVCHNITGADKRALLLETLRVLKKGGVVARIILPPAPEVSVNIRKGVAVDDAPSTIAG